MSKLTPTAASPAEVAMVLPGDELVPGANFVLDRATTLPATPDELWPWLVQFGKGRGGWYSPRVIERLLPPRGRGLRHIEPRLQHLAVADIVPDWGPGHPTFTVAKVEPPSDLVFRSTRGRIEFSWALHVSAVGDDSRLHTRFRMGRTDAKPGSRPLRAVGDFIDWVTIALLFAGLRERLSA